MNANKECFFPYCTFSSPSFGVDVPFCAGFRAYKPDSSLVQTRAGIYSVGCHRFSMFFLYQSRWRAIAKKLLLPGHLLRRHCFSLYQPGNFLQSLVRMFPLVGAHDLGLQDWYLELWHDGMFSVLCARPVLLSLFPDMIVRYGIYSNIATSLRLGMPKKNWMMTVI